MHPLEAALREYAGKPLGVSDWVLIDQNRINQFADSTNDHQWIHVDTERASRELPGGKTIAHGFLTLSLVAGMLPDVIKLPGVAKSLNYGLNKVRFLAPVPVDSRVRAQVSLLDWEQTRKGYLTTWGVEVQLDGGDKPVCVAESLGLLQPTE